MRGVRFHEFGDAGVLQCETDIPEPVALEDETIVTVKACALNHLDVWIRRGVPAYQTQLPHILGCDIAGIDAEGNKVLVNPIVACGICRWCLAGRDNLCAKGAVIGAGRPGGYAERAAVPKRNLFPIPEGWKWEEAAAFPLVFQTAWHMLVALANVEPGESVLVIGGGSGVGSAAIQIARHHSASVVTTAGTDDKRRRCMEIGANAAIDHYADDWVAQAKEANNGRLFDIAFEHVGGHIFEGCLKLLGKGGRLVTCGGTIDAQPKADVRYLFSRELTIKGGFIGTKQDLAEALDAARQGALKPIVSETLPLEKAQEAHRKIEAGDVFGKIVLTL